MNVTAWITVSRGGGGTGGGVLNMTGGTVNIGQTGNQVSMGWGGVTTSVVNIANSSLLFGIGSNLPVDLNRVPAPPARLEWSIFCLVALCESEV